MKKMFKDGSPIVISVDDIEADSTKHTLKDIIETGEIAAIIKNEVEECQKQS